MTTATRDWILASQKRECVEYHQMNSMKIWFNHCLIRTNDASAGVVISVIRAVRWAQKAPWCNSRSRRHIQFRCFIYLLYEYICFDGRNRFTPVGVRLVRLVYRQRIYYNITHGTECKIQENWLSTMNKLVHVGCLIFMWKTKHKNLRKMKKKKTCTTFIRPPWMFI